MLEPSATPAPEPLLHVVLVEPEIPPNTGNVSRLCAATRVRLHLVGPLGFSLDDKQLKRAGLDYWPYLDWRQWPDLATFQAAHGAANPIRCHYFTTKAKRPFTAAAYQPGDFLVFGKETRGLPEELLAAHPEACVTIPMAHPQVRSLNLSTSVGIGLYEALRQVGALAGPGFSGAAGRT